MGHGNGVDEFVSHAVDFLSSVVSTVGYYCVKGVDHRCLATVVVPFAWLYRLPTVEALRLGSLEQAAHLTNLVDTEGFLFSRRHLFVTLR